MEVEERKLRGISRSRILGFVRERRAAATVARVYLPGVGVSEEEQARGEVVSGRVGGELVLVPLWRLCQLFGFGGLVGVDPLITY